MWAFSENVKSPAFITPWSLIHILSGMLFYSWMSLLFPYISIYALVIMWLLIHTVYEFKDWYVSYVQGKGNNSLWNSLGDELCGMLGFALGYLIIGHPVNYQLLIIFTLGTLLLLTYFLNKPQIG